MTKTVAILAAGLLVVGCRTRAVPSKPGPSAGVTPPEKAAIPEQEEIDSVLRAVQQLYGPPSSGSITRGELPALPSAELRHDFNGDGRKEIVIFFADKCCDRPEVNSISDVQNLIVSGFIVLTRIEGRLWPVFYSFSESRMSLHHRTELGITGLVSEGGRDHVQNIWGWRAKDDAGPGKWVATWRKWISNEEGYGPRHVLPKCFAAYFLK